MILSVVFLFLSPRWIAKDTERSSGLEKAIVGKNWCFLLDSLFLLLFHPPNGFCKGMFMQCAIAHARNS